MATKSTKAKPKTMAEPIKMMEVDTFSMPIQSEPMTPVMAAEPMAPYSMGSLVKVAKNNAGLIFIGLSIFIVGFLAGSIWTENKLLKSGVGTPVAAAQPAAAAPTAPGAQAPTPTQATVTTGNLPARGNANAPIAIVEFADLRCPFCKQFFDVTEPSIIKDYVATGKAKFYFRNYAFLGPASTLAANASECANDQGKFWDMYDYLYKNQPSEQDTSMFTNDNLTKIATGLGVNGPKFSDCLTNTRGAANVAADIADGNQAGGGSMGTPSFVIGKVGSDGKVTGSLLVGAQPYSAFQTALNAIK